MLSSVLIVFGCMALFGAVEHAFGLYRRPGVLTMRELGAGLVALASMLLVRAAVSGVVMWAFGAFWPGSEGALAGVSFWIVFPLYLLVSDYGFYVLHRKSHESAWLWWIHKPHHTPRSLNVAVTYRENWLWPLLIVDTWLAPVLVWLGHPGAYVAGLVFRAVITLMVHSELRWDLHLQRNRFTRPVMWVLERVITLPDVHHVHHGVGRHGNAMKNYGAALSLFDLLHGTLVIPHARQEAFGLPEGAPIEPWAEQIFWPLVRSTKETADGRRPIEEGSTPAELAAAKAVILTADGRAVVVR